MIDLKDAFKDISTEHRKGKGISILVPLSRLDSHSQRAKNWKWLKKFWKDQLPKAEIIIGRDQISWDNPKIPFSKSAAVNNAASKAKGDIYVIVDADGYISISAILYCATKIRRSIEKGYRLWYIPYRQFYRLTEEASQYVLRSSPKRPYKFTTPPPKICIQNTSGSQHGHWFGAMIQILPKEAFEEVGGWDPRFRGWGGEDHAAMRATDTLYWPHKTLSSQVLHIWHPMHNPMGKTSDWVNWDSRVWEGQDKAGANDKLVGRYYGAGGHLKRMRRLVDEWLKG